MQNNIPKQVLKGLGGLIKETAEKATEETGKIVTGVITGGELLSDIKPMTPEEETRKKMKEENERQEELKKVRAQMDHGRNAVPAGRQVEEEIKQVVEEKDKKEDEEERAFLEKIRMQREAEETERQQMEVSMGISSNPAKQKKSRGSAFAKGKKKSQPQADQMSATSEFKGKVD